MPEQPRSQAVESLNRERARRDDQDDQLDRELEDTFPASDPLSATRAGASASSRNSAYSPEPAGSQTASLLRSARSEGRSYLADAEDRIRERPFAAIAFAATLGFIYGMTR